MEPRSAERGNAGASERTGAGSIASMEPRSAERGNVAGVVKGFRRK